MSLTDDSKIRINYTDNSSAAQYFDLPKPNKGYQSIIRMPIDFSYQADTTVEAFDSGQGNTLDVRECSCELFLNETEQALLTASVFEDARARDITLELATDSGFFPFGADYGDAGSFTCSMIIEDVGSIGMAPYRHFKNRIRFTMSGNPPSYTLPDDETVGEGPVTIGTVQGLRFPDLWFQARQGIGVNYLIKNGGSADYLDRGASADIYRTDFELRMRTSKVCRLLKYLTSTGRATALTGMVFTVPTGCYPFGRNKDSGGSFVAKSIMDTLVITHVGYNYFKMSLSLAYVSG